MHTLENSNAAPAGQSGALVSGTLLGDWEPRRAPECDTAAREASIDGLLTFVLIRHGAWSGASDANPHKAIYLEARDNAIRELKWRILQNWHEAELHCRKWQRISETLDAMRGVMQERAGYEKPIKGPEWPFASPNVPDEPRPKGAGETLST